MQIKSPKDRVGNILARKYGGILENMEIMQENIPKIHQENKLMF